MKVEGDADMREAFAVFIEAMEGGTKVVKYLTLHTKDCVNPDAYDVIIKDPLGDGDIHSQRSAKKGKVIFSLLK